jgi:hypothetical protein
MRALRTGEDRFRCGWRSGGGRRQAVLDALVAHKLHAGAPMGSAAGVAPEQWGRADDERMRASR